MIYLDSSALVKRFVLEEGSDRVNDLVAEADAVAVASISYAEVHAGLQRKRRMSELSDQDLAAACRELERDWPAYLRVALTDEILIRARDLIHRHGLRGYDAVQLASIIDLGLATGIPVLLVASDAPLLKAARAKGLKTLDPAS